MHGWMCVCTVYTVCAVCTVVKFKNQEFIHIETLKLKKTSTFRPAAENETTYPSRITNYCKA